MGNSQSFDDDMTYGKDSLYAETDDSSMIVYENGNKDQQLLQQKQVPAFSRSTTAPVVPQNRNQMSYGRTNDYQQREPTTERGRDWTPDDLSDRDELSAMTDMAWKHLSNRIRSQSNTVVLINADEEYSLRQSRDDDVHYDERKSDAAFRARSSMNPSSPLRDPVYKKSAIGPSLNGKKATHQGEIWNKKSEQDKYSTRTNSAEESISRYSKETVLDAPPSSPESFFGFGGIWGNDSPHSTKSDHSPVYSPRSPISLSSPRRNEEKHAISTRLEYITSRLDAMTESQISNSIQAEKVWEQETIQEECLNSLLLDPPRQLREERNLDVIYARLDELSKSELVIDDPTESLTQVTIQETIIHDDEIQIESDSAIEVQQIDRQAALFQPEIIESKPTLSKAQIESKDGTLAVEKIPSDDVIEEPQVDRQAALSQPETIESNPAPSEAQIEGKDGIVTVEKIPSSDAQHGALVFDTSFSARSTAQKPKNDIIVEMGADVEKPGTNVTAKAASVILSATAARVLSPPRVHMETADLLITEDFLDQCGNFVSNLVGNPLSPCNPAVIHDHDEKTIVDQDDRGKASLYSNLATTGNVCMTGAADAHEAKPENTIDQILPVKERTIAPAGSSDQQSIISDELDVEFVQKYANLFEAFLTENMDLMDQNPDMISFLYVAKLTKIMEASEKLESAFKKRIVKLRSDKDSVLSLYREDLIEAAKEKVVKGIQHEQDLKILQETGRVIEGKLKWKLLMENASRARHESILVQTLWKTTMDVDAPLDYLPAGHETQVIRQAAVARPSEVPESHDVLLKDLRRFQIENNFLNAEISVLEGKLNQRKLTASTHQWVDSVFRRLGSKPKKVMRD